MSIESELLEKINGKKAKVGIIGLGYVGLPLVLRFAEEGFDVLGFDIDSDKTEKMNRGESYLLHFDSERIAALVNSGRLSATTDFLRLGECDCLLICVPTPLTKQREPDTSYVLKTAAGIAATLRKGQLIILESTTYPGTTEELLLPLLEEGGLRCGEDFFMAFSPEREDPSRTDFNLKTTPKVVGGHTGRCLVLAEALYDSIVDKTIPLSDTKTAEATKLFENIFRSVNIALVNELKMIFEKMGIDIWEVIGAASTKPFGFMPFYPGPGLGGHCIPIDPFYLTWKAREFEVPTRFIELAGEINAFMPHYVVSKVSDALNEHGKSLKGSRVLILGVAYKKDVDDMRESPSIRLIELLGEKGSLVDYNDPCVPVFPRLRSHDIHLKSVELSAENIAAYDAVVIATDHSVYDYDWIVEHSGLVIDTRNTTKDVKKNRERIVKA